MMRFRRFHEAYLTNLARTYLEPEFVNAPRGARSRERLGVQIEIENPVERVCYLPERRTNLVFNFAEALWYLSGDDSLDFIAYYAPGIRRYSADGRRLTGTAYGPKLRRFGTAALDQWRRVLNLLRAEDPASKRAVIQIFSAEEALGLDNIDVSCTLGWQFLVREGRLHMLAYMRANDAYRGMVSDVFSFTFAQELAARELNLELGSYHHMVGSMHVYDGDEPQVSSTLAGAARAGADLMPPRGGGAGRQGFPVMPAGQNWDHLLRVLDWERVLRTGKHPPRAADIDREHLPEYWRQVLLLLAVYRVIVDGRQPDGTLVDALLPVYRQLCAARWPKHMGAGQHA